MRILTRYLLRIHVGPFLFALTALTGILFANTIARRFEDLADKGLPLSVVGEVFLFSLPHILALTLPMAVLVAVLYAFAQLAADNEITALKASGTNLIHMIRPLLFAAFLLSLLMVWFNDRILPDANNRLKGVMADIAAKTPTLQLQEQVVNRIQTGNYRLKYWIRPGRIDDQTRRMWDVVIYDLSNARQARTVYADSGRMALNETQTDLLLTLYDGVVHETGDRQPTELQRVAFKEQRIEMKGVGTELRRHAHEYRTDREMTVAMLRAVVDTARLNQAAVAEEGRQHSLTAVERLLAGPLETEPVAVAGEGLTLPDPWQARRPVRDDPAYRAAMDAQRVANQVQNLENTINQHSVEIHKKFAIPFACIIFVLIGAPIAVRFPRGGVGMVIATSLAIFGIYYMSLIGGESLGDRGTIAPFWGPWAPNLLFGAIGVWALSRMGRETSTSRGGGWDDMWLAIRHVLTGGFLRRNRKSGS